MEIWPIDFDKTLQEISEWIDSWKVERYGADSLNPERYYKLTPDGRYIYGKGGEGVAEGESLNQEKADCEHLLDILCRLRLINQKLKGTGLSQHLQWQERERMKTERETLYMDYMDIVQVDIVKQQPEPQQGELRYYCEKLVTMGYLGKVGTGYRRVEGKMTKALLAYFLKHFLNADGTFPDKEYCLMFGESRLSKAADQLSMNKKGYGKPRGYEVVENLLNM